EQRFIEKRHKQSIDHKDELSAAAPSLSPISYPLVPMMHSESIAQVGSQRRIERLAGSQERIVDRVLGASAADFIEILMQGLQIAFTQGAGVAVQVVGLLEPFEARRAVEGKVEFVVVHDMKHHHVVPLLAEQLEPLEQALAVNQQV